MKLEKATYLITDWLVQNVKKKNLLSVEIMRAFSFFHM